MKNLSKSIPALVGVGCLAASVNARADTLLSDGFNTGANAPLTSFNVGGTSPTTAERQGGILAGTDWVSPQGVQQVNNNQVLFNIQSGGTARAYANHNFHDSAITAAGGFVVSFNLTPSSSISGNTEWFGLTVGEQQSFISDPTKNFDLVNPVTDFGILMRGTGGYQAFDSAAGTAGSSSGITWNYDAANLVQLQVLTSSFANGATADLSLTVNGVAVDLDSSAAGNDRLITWTGDNYIGLETTLNGVFRMDDFTVSTVPEPGTMVLGSLGGLLGLITWQRRKAAK